MNCEMNTWYFYLTQQSRMYYKLSSPNALFIAYSPKNWDEPFKYCSFASGMMLESIVSRGTLKKIDFFFFCRSWIQCITPARLLHTCFSNILQLQGDFQALNSSPQHSVEQQWYLPITSFPNQPFLCLCSELQSAAYARDFKLPVSSLVSNIWPLSHKAWTKNLNKQLLPVTLFQPQW
jgi:hypothetical protein